MASQQRYTCARCTALTKVGVWCKNSVCIGDRCWTHHFNRNYQDNNPPSLRVKASQTGHGRGLFTGKRPINVPANRQKVIVDYTGDKLTQAQVDARYPGDRTAQYVLCNDDDWCFDARRTNAGLAQYANDPRGTRFRANTEYGQPIPRGRQNPPTLRTVKKKRAWTIPPNSEIFVKYGDDYWTGHH